MDEKGDWHSSIEEDLTPASKIIGTIVPMEIGSSTMYKAFYRGRVVCTVDAREVPWLLRTFVWYGHDQAKLAVETQHKLYRLLDHHERY